MHRTNRAAYASIVVGSLFLLAVMLATCGSQDMGTQVEATTAPTVTETPSPVPPVPGLTPVLTRTVQISDEAAAVTKTAAPLSTVSAGTATAVPEQTILPQPDSVPISPTMTMPDSRRLQRWVEMAMEDLGPRLNAGEDEIELIEVRSVVWPDGSLGCPRPGYRYIQVTVDGLLIRLRVGDEVYDYHSSIAESPFLCLQDANESPASSKLTPGPALTALPKGTKEAIPMPASRGQQSLVEQAMTDLAQQLGVPTDEIELVGFETVVWPNKGLGCPKPGMSYAQVQVEGSRVLLQAGGSVYAYHSGGGKAPFLCEQ